MKSFAKIFGISVFTLQISCSDRSSKDSTPVPVVVAAAENPSEVPLPEPSLVVENDNKEEPRIFVFRGEDPVKALLGEEAGCEVTLLEEITNGDKSYRIRTSFNHNGETHADLFAKALEPTASTLSAADENNQSQAFFKFVVPGDVLSMQAMNLKWFHINHYDTGVCENLKL